MLLTLLFLLLLRGALVVRLLAFAKTHGDLHAPAHVMQVERHQGVAGAIDLADEAADLLRVEQELARAHGIGPYVRGGGRERADVRADQEDLAVLHDHVGFFQLRASRADRLDLPALRGDARSAPLLPEILVPRLAVLGARTGGA